MGADWKLLTRGAFGVDELAKQMLQWLIDSDEKAGGRTLFKHTDQHEVVLSADGTLAVPLTLLEKLGWRPGHRLLLEQTDDGVLLTEIEAPGEGAMRRKRLTPR